MNEKFFIISLKKVREKTNRQVVRDSMAKQIIALFGGTFDPVHVGHIAVTRCAAETIRAEKVIFIPARRSPLKSFFPRASDEDRLNMIELAIADESGFEVSDYEIKKKGPGFTLQTVRKFKEDLGPRSDIYWLAGADVINELNRWHGILDLIDECNLAVMYRAGCNKPDFSKYEDAWSPQRVKKMRSNIIETPLVDISSTDIRKRLVAGEDPTEMPDILHPKVAAYIKARGLYK
jgi:nicotinate-nucleotide adenylyltransferase